MDVEEKYPAFPKIPRLRRTIIVTEKIDGTNALVHVSLEGVVRAGSRTRWITADRDNYGFAAWVKEHEDELRNLGPGHHYGEWWGGGIQRGYGMETRTPRGSQGGRDLHVLERRFSLFNTSRWSMNPITPESGLPPACCHVVPVLYVGVNSDTMINRCLTELNSGGSVAAPGFMKPEGVVVFHTASGTLGKILLESDDKPKGA